MIAFDFRRIVEYTVAITDYTINRKLTSNPSHTMNTKET